MATTPKCRGAPSGRRKSAVTVAPELPGGLDLIGRRVDEGVVAAVGHTDGTDAVHALRMLRSLFHGFAVLEAAGGFQMDTDVDDSFTWLIDFIDTGLSK